MNEAKQRPSTGKSKTKMKTKAKIDRGGGTKNVSKSSHTKKKPTFKPGDKRKRQGLDSSKRSKKAKSGTKARSVKALTKRTAQVDATEKRFKEMKVLFNAIMQKSKVLEDGGKPESNPNNASSASADKVEALFGLLQGRVKSLAMKHDMCRTIQCCFKFGTAHMKATILSELEGELVGLAKGKYSCFMLVAFLRHGGAQERATVLKALQGHMTRLGTHNCAAHVVELAVQDTASDTKNIKAIRRRLFAEFYGERYRLSAAVTTKVEAALLLNVVPEESRMQVLADVRRILQKQADKGLLRYAFAQRLLFEYVQSAEKGEAGVDAMTAIQPVVPLVYEASLAMVSTSAGAKALCRILAFAQAKDKRKVIKKWKGHTQNMAMHDNGYLVVLAALNMTDDTVLLRKSVVSDLLAMSQQKLLASVLDPTGIGRKVILFVIAHPDRLPRYLSKDEREVIAPASGTAKKGEEQRKEEYRDGFKEVLVKLCEDNLLSMICDQKGVDVVFEVVARWTPTSITDSLAELVKEKGSEVLEQKYAQLLINRILQIESGKKERGFAQRMLQIMKPNLDKWLGINRPAFVINALLEHSQVAEEVKDLLKPHKKNIQANEKLPASKVLLKNLEK